MLGFPGSSAGKESCDVGDLGSIPGLGRSPGGGHCNPLQYSCLEGYSPWDRRVTERLMLTHSLTPSPETFSPALADPPLSRPHR